MTPKREGIIIDEYGWLEVHTALCPTCKTRVFSYEYSETMVGYYSPDGHNHDDNCLKYSFNCWCGTSWVERKRNSCPVCPWEGKLRCEVPCCPEGQYKVNLGKPLPEDGEPILD